MSRRIRVGIVGCGAIGTVLARYCVKSFADRIKVCAIFDIDRKRSLALKRGLPGTVTVSKSIDTLVRSSDLVIEAASASAAQDVLKRCTSARKDIMIMSVGGVIDKQDLLAAAEKRGCKIYLPSGAIVGLDGIKAASIGKIEEIILTTRKPPRGLKGAPYIVRKNIDLDSIKKEKVIFEGTADKAVKAFPKNINVSATLSLAGVGAKRTKVRIICSPGSRRNIHEIEVKGEFGRIFVKTENVPSPDNPKTSYLTALSAIATVKGIIDGVRIGT